MTLQHGTGATVDSDTVAALSAEDVRRLVMEDWTDSGADGRDFLRRQALFTRCPDCQPEGLEYSDKYLTWLNSEAAQDVHGPYIPVIIPICHATDLILMSIARSGTAVWVVMQKVGLPVAHGLDEYTELTYAIMSGDLPDAVAARHRLADLEDKA